MADEVGPYVPVPPVNRNGGKKNARKPTQLLRALRRVSQQEPAADVSNLEKELRKIKDSDPGDFLDRLQRAEGEQKRAIVASQRNEPKQSSGAASAVGPKAAPEAADESEAKCLGLLEELLKTRGWMPPEQR